MNFESNDARYNYYSNSIDNLYEKMDNNSRKKKVKSFFYKLPQDIQNSIRDDIDKNFCYKHIARKYDLSYYMILKWKRNNSF